MSLTRAEFETEMVDRCGRLLTTASKDGTTVNGTNSSLNGPARSALSSLGITPSAFTVTDSDFSTVTADLYPRLFDTAEFYTLRSIENALTSVDQAFGEDSIKYSQLRDSVSARINSLESYLRKTYGFGMAKLSTGLIDLGFQSSADDQINP